MQVILIRHGSTAGNLEYRYVGTTDEPLTEEAADDLKKRKGNYPGADALFVSPLRRCVQTADLLYPHKKQQIVADLRECSFGDFEYKNYMELQGNEKYQSWIDSGGILPFPGGESRKEFADRCCRAFEACCKEALMKNCERAAFVVHGGTIMAIMERYGRPQKNYFDWQVKNVEGFCGDLIRKEESAEKKNERCNEQTETGFIISNIQKVEKVRKLH